MSEMVKNIKLNKEINSDWETKSENFDKFNEFIINYFKQH